MASDEQEKARKELGDKLRLARETAKMTQQEVATAAGVHVNFYARVERGEENPSFDKLRNIMKVLKIESLDLH
jgi:transcriptional regulator with XRE-family HTH domain